MLVYRYKCTNVGFLNSSTYVAPWTACKGAFKQDHPHGKYTTAGSAMGFGKLIDTKLSFQMNHASMYGAMIATFMLDAMPVNAVFQSAL